MTKFEDFLNATIPIIVVIAGLFLLGRPFIEPFKDFIRAIKGKFSRKEETEMMMPIPKYIYYE